jgi:hypothetical protein
MRNALIVLATVIVSTSCVMHRARTGETSSQLKPSEKMAATVSQVSDEGRVELSVVRAQGSLDTNWLDDGLFLHSGERVAFSSWPSGDVTVVQIGSAMTHPVGPQLHFRIQGALREPASIIAEGDWASGIHRRRAGDDRPVLASGRIYVCTTDYAARAHLITYRFELEFLDKQGIRPVFGAFVLPDERHELSGVEKTDGR